MLTNSQNSTENTNNTSNPAAATSGDAEDYVPLPLYRYKDKQSEAENNDEQTETGNNGEESVYTNTNDMDENASQEMLSEDQTPKSHAGAPSRGDYASGAER